MEGKVNLYNKVATDVNGAPDVPGPGTSCVAQPHPEPVHLDEAGAAWQPYECAYTETVVPLARSIPYKFYKWRWMALNPFHRRVGVFPYIGAVTWGELIVLLAGLGVAAGWAASTWGHVDAGNVAVAFLIAAYVLAGRNNAVTFLLGLSHERAIAWHGLAAAGAVGLALYHGLIEEYVDPKKQSAEARAEHKYFFVTGWIGFGLMAALVVTSASRIMRHYFFNTWQVLHWAFLILVVLVVALHSATTVLFGAAAWGLDLLLRWWYQAGLRNPHTVEVVALPADVVRVSWDPSNFDYAGGQYVFLNIPAISWAEFHPFSLSSAPGHTQVHVHVRVLGDWTRRLHNFAIKDAIPGQPKVVKAFIEGPFGSPSIDMYGSRFKAFLLVSGGIGVTPVQSFFNHLMAQRARGRPVKLAHLVWSVRDRALVSNVLGFDDVYASQRLPASLPVSFQPDLISPNLYQDGACLAPQPAPYTPPPAATVTGGAACAAPLAGGAVLAPVAKVASTSALADLERADAVLGRGVMTGPGSDDFIATEFYLTQARDNDRTKANIRPELQPALRLGRPDLPKLFMDTARRAESLKEREVAVFVCGPHQMVQEAQALAAAISKPRGGVVFHVHAEVFEAMPYKFYKWRWMALYPFHRRIGVFPLVGAVTWGELTALLAGLGVAAGWAAGSWGDIGAGNVAVAFLIAAYVLASRNNAVTFLLGLSHERAIAWHGLAAAGAVALALYHGLIEQLGWGAAGEDSETIDDDFDSYVLTGWIGFGLMAALVATSASRAVRQYLWNTWQMLHWVLLVAVFVVVTIHSAAAVLIGAGVWAFDLLLRWLYQAGLQNPHMVEIVALPSDVVRVSWDPADFSYAGGQYVFLNIPALSWLEFHPFSLSSAPGENRVHLHVRVLGDWTRRLHTLATKDVTPGQPKVVKAFIEGPFGSPSIDMYGSRFKAFLLVSGGIGVTPVQSFFNHLMAQRARGRPVKLAHMVWSVRDRALVTSVLGYDDVYAAEHLPSSLPLSFQPDLISPNQYANGANIGPQPGTPYAPPTPAGAHVPMAPLAAYATQQQQQRAMDHATSTTALVDMERGVASSSSSDGGAAVSGAGDYIATEFYLTQARTEAASAKANIRPELQPALRLGRPDLPKIFGETAQRAEFLQLKEVAVYVCGPSAMVEEVEKLAAANSKWGGVTFHVHSEVFQF
ncbi:hypothetical protein HYH02_006812 [Chlamydomonas schloesseri]|uniref:FAD-binding FR-type domain-containing protein n=1 Tax=Chlamydomonas schloesseri TaxID=2026947 RepID=A0A835WIM0_9CHLO|nr:hypothetical protein HYH02_006812 [Chlamydomonas schloesseri]|eukprot:KAG2448227.1 hypothetical protein HYH02_006812 [Chlamydomonas schloesseri]